MAINKNIILKLYRKSLAEYLTEKPLLWNKFICFNNYSCGETVCFNYLDEMHLHLSSRTCSFSMASYFLMKQNLNVIYDFFIKGNSVENIIFDQIDSEIYNLFYFSSRRKKCVLAPLFNYYNLLLSI